ncbi:MAG: hypothetical protein HC846_09455 [Blastocatellia bacterium]|nr:hypothetical protein [Blastocatellia bacterium]
MRTKGNLALVNDEDENTNLKQTAAIEKRLKQFPTNSTNSSTSECGSA